MINIFNSANPGSQRVLSVDEVTVRAVRLNSQGEPYMVFSHPDYPLGDLSAEFRDGAWQCDMD